MELQEFVKKLGVFMKEREWDKRISPSGVAKSVCIESAELLELFQWKEPTFAAVKKDKELLQKLRHEVADVILYALQFPLALGFDPMEILEEKLAHNAKKYPASAMRGASGSKEYYRRKEAQRKKTKKKTS